MYKFLPDDEVALEEQPGFTEWISIVAKLASIKAVAETWAAGRPVTIAKDGYIVLLYSNGSYIRKKKLADSCFITDDRYVAKKLPDGTIEKMYKLSNSVKLCSEKGE